MCSKMPRNTFGWPHRRGYSTGVPLTPLKKYSQKFSLLTAISNFHLLGLAPVSKDFEMYFSFDKAQQVGCMQPNPIKKLACIC